MLSTLPARAEQCTQSAAFDLRDTRRRRLLRFGLPDGILQGQAVEALPPGTATILVHALNPFGFAWLRRVKRGQCRSQSQLSGFREAASAVAGIRPSAQPAGAGGLGRPGAGKQADAALMKHIVENGERAVQAVVSGGQHSRADGLFYGGREETWSNRTFRQILRDHVPAGGKNSPSSTCTPDWVRRATASRSISVLRTKTRNRARKWYGPSVRSPAVGDSVSAKLTGTVADAVIIGVSRFDDHLCRARVWHGALARRARAPRADNWLHAVPDRRVRSPPPSKTKSARPFMLKRLIGKQRFTAGSPTSCCAPVAGWPVSEF